MQPLCRCAKCKLSMLCLPVGVEQFASKCYRCLVCERAWYWSNTDPQNDDVEFLITHYNTCSAVIALITNTGICEPCYNEKTVCKM